MHLLRTLEGLRVAVGLAVADAGAEVGATRVGEFLHRLNDTQASNPVISAM